MTNASPRNHHVLGVLGILAALALGALLRLVDPLSSPVIPAEDPFTHMALVREHVRDGTLDPLSATGSLYPPGIHVAMAAVWILTGIPLESIVRFGPAVLGTIGIAGIALLLWRQVGPLSSAVGALAYAVVPEIVFRTSMMSPTAFDLALVPFFAFALFEVLGGRLGWLPMTVALGTFLAIAHPWLLALLAPAGFLFLVFILMFPADGRFHGQRSSKASASNETARTSNTVTTSNTSNTSSPSETSTTAPVATSEEAWNAPRRAGRASPFITGPGIAVATTTLAFATAATVLTGPGFVRTIQPGASEAWAISPLLLVLAVVIPIGLIPVLLQWRFPRALQALADRAVAGPGPMWARIAGSVALLIALVVVTQTALGRGLPELVNLPRMVGWPVLALAAIGYVALPWLPYGIARFGAGLATVTYPFVVFNPLDSPYWPHRTVAFMTIGLVVLAGAAAAGAILAGRALTVRSGSAPLRRIMGLDDRADVRESLRGSGFARTAALSVIPTVLFMTVLGGSVVALTPPTYDSWYRLYQECEMDAIDEIAEEISARPDAVIITGSWQSRLVLAAYTDDASRIWYKPEFFRDAEQRQDQLDHSYRMDIPTYVLVDVHMGIENPELDTGFLNAEPWEYVDGWCQDARGQDWKRMNLYGTLLDERETDNDAMGGF